MSRDYQKGRNIYDSNDQDYDSGYSRQTEEYRDLYNPYKSVWDQALKSRIPKQQHGNKHSNYRPEEHRATQVVGGRGYNVTFERTSSSSGQHGMKHSGINIPSDKVSRSEEEIFDSGYNVTLRNTYGYRTTGYGPRD